MRRLLAPALALLFACGSEDEAPAASEPDDKSQALGFYRTALPILEARCQSCHVKGGAAPFALETYEDVSRLAGSVRSAVLERRMPPLPADDSNCRPLSDSRKMLEEEREALIDWIDAELPMDGPGDRPAQRPPSMLGAHEQPLGEPTQRADFGLPYAPPPSLLDEYRCLIVDPGWTAPHHLRGVGVKPGNQAIVHHVIVFAQLPAQRAAVDALDAADPAPGYTCFGGAGFPGAAAVGNYVPGASDRGFPDGATVTLPAGSRFVVQMHYNLLSGSGDDNTELLFWEADAPSATRTSNVVLINTGFRIPAGAADFSATGQAWIREGEPAGMIGLGALQGAPGLVWGVGGHMHTRGKAVRVDLVRADGQEECLLDIPRWSFSWQGQYRFMEPLWLFDGDRLRITCAWDNSAENQPVVNGQRLVPKEITWGEGTLDEMCLGTVQMTR